MLRRSWSHWVLFAVLVLFIALAIGVFTGAWTQFFGEDNVALARRWVDSVLQHKYAGFGGSAIVATYGLWKAYRLGNKQLPTRLNEFLNRELVKQSKHRDELRAAVSSAPSVAIEGAISAGDIRRNDRRAEALRREIETLERDPFNKSSDFSKLKQNFDIVEKDDRLRRTEMATAHFIRGLKFAEAADQNLDREVARKSSIEELVIAAELDKTDPRILRACFEESEKVSRRDGLKQLLRSWVEAAKGRENSREQGRGRLELAKCIFDEREISDDDHSDVKRELRLARDQSWEACAIFDSHPPAGTDADNLLARARELTGDIEAELRNKPSAGGNYSTARAIFWKLKDIKAIDRVTEKIIALGGSADENVPPPPPPPSVRLLRAMCELAEAKLACAANSDAQSAGNNAKRHLRDNVPASDISEDDRIEWNARIDEFLRRASQSSQQT